MSLFIAGGDGLGKITHKMKKIGFDDIIHFPGRKKSVYRNFQLPSEVEFVLVLTDYINHSLMQKIKDEARSKDIKLLFAKRSWSSIHKKLEEIKQLRSVKNTN